MLRLTEKNWADAILKLGLRADLTAILTKAVNVVMGTGQFPTISQSDFDSLISNVFCVKFEQTGEKYLLCHMRGRLFLQRQQGD